MLQKENSTQKKRKVKNEMLERYENFNVSVFTVVIFPFRYIFSMCFVRFSAGKYHV